MVALDENKQPLLNPSKWNKKWAFGDDKIEHGLAGAVLGVGTYLVVEDLLGSLKLTKSAVAIISTVAAICVIVGAMYGKEVWDSLGNGFPDIWDAICGILGGLIMLVVFIIGYIWFKRKGGDVQWV
jgi:ABC-type dipeptide/oligopeptide/nickel transport system permease component